MTPAESILRHEVAGNAPDGPEAAEASVVVLLHGRGADRHDLLGLHRHLPAGTTLVTPEAPHPGAPWGYGPGWAWYRYIAEDRVVEPTLADSLGRLDALIDTLPATLGRAPGPLLLGGFSQGGTTALAYALTRPGRVAGVVMLSGFLVDAPELVPVTEASAGGLRVFWGHGFADPAIPHALAVRGRGRLEAAGALVTAHDYPMGHQVAPAELDDLAAWMEGTDPVKPGGGAG